MTPNKNIPVYITYLILLLTAFVFITLFSRGSSPLYVYYTYDSSIFLTMGNVLLDGKLLYVDCFDHKGPVLFFIEAFAQSIIGGRTGIYIFQIINMFLVLVMIYKTIDLFKISLSVKIFCIVSFLLVLRLIFGEGNQTEEYSLLCSCISLYITLKYFLLPSSNLSSLRIFILGLCLSVVFWTRPNNAGIIVGCILFLFILTLKEKNIRLAAKYICFIFIGFLSLSFIICSYFYYKGTLGDMLYSSFIFNFIYSKVGRASGLRILQIIFYNLVVFVPLLGGILSYQKKNKDKNSILLLVCLFVCGFCFSNFGFKQFYYIAALTPLVPVGFAFWKDNALFSSQKNKTILNALSAIICLFILFTFAYRYDKYRDFDVEYIKSAKELINRIPENELKNTYAYHTEAKIYLVTPLKPIYKYSFFQEWHAVNDPAILGDLNNYLRTENTHYVITQNSLMTGSYNLEAQKILRQDYDTIFSNEHLTLYKHINKR